MFTTRDHVLQLIARKPIKTLPLPSITSTCGLCGHPLMAKSREALAEARADHRRAMLDLGDESHLMLNEAS